MMLKPLYWTSDFVWETGNGMDVVTDYRFGHRCNYCQIAAQFPYFHHQAEFPAWRESIPEYFTFSTSPYSAAGRSRTYGLL